MRWADERYVKVYTRDTAELIALGWEARALFWELLRKTDRAGIVSVGKTGVRGLVCLTGFPIEVIERALPLLLEDGCVVERPGTYVIRNFVPAQETPQSDKARKQAQRERDRAAAIGVHEDVTGCHAESREVTPSQPSQDEPSQDKTNRRALDAPEEDAEGEQETLLDVLARMVARGEAWAVKVEGRRQGRHDGRLTEREKEVLRARRVEDAKRAGGGHTRPVLTAADEADVQAIVEAYDEAYRRIIADPKFVVLSVHHTDAAAILPDARRLAERCKRGDWRPTPAEVVAHRLESYLRDTKNRPTFRLRWIFDRTEQDDLPKPPARAAPKATIPEGPIGTRRGPVLKPTPPPPDVAAQIAKIGKAQ